MLALISGIRKASCRGTAALAAITVAVGGATAAHAQGCAMCYNTASAAPIAAIQALRSGILVLLFPPLVMFLGIIALFLRRRNRFDERDSEWQSSEAPPLQQGFEEGLANWPDARSGELEEATADRECVASLTD